MIDRGKWLARKYQHFGEISVQFASRFPGPDTGGTLYLLSQYKYSPTLREEKTSS